MQVCGFSTCCSYDTSPGKACSQGETILSVCVVGEGALFVYLFIGRQRGVMITLVVKILPSGTFHCQTRLAQARRLPLMMGYAIGWKMGQMGARVCLLTGEAACIMLCAPRPAFGCLTVCVCVYWSFG